MLVSNRAQARKIGEILNMIAGHKKTKQARTKDHDRGGYPILFAAGTLKCPPTASARIKKGLPPQRVKAKQILLVGRDLLSANDHSAVNRPYAAPQRDYGTMATLFTNL